MRIPLTGGRRPGLRAERWLAFLGILTMALWLAVTVGCGESSQAQSGSSGGTPTANHNADDEEPGIPPSGTRTPI